MDPIARGEEGIPHVSGAFDEREIVGLITLAENRLTAAPDLDLMQLKTVLEETLGELGEIEATVDPEMRELKRKEVRATLESARTILELVEKLKPAPADRAAKKNVVIPAAWDDPDRPLH